MKKLVLLGIVGSMLVAGQSMVFAQSAKEVPLTSLTKSIAATNVSFENKDVLKAQETIKATLINFETKATPITKDQAVKIAKVLNLDSKKLEKQTMTELMKNLSKEDFNKLAENGIIQVGKAATSEAKETLITKDQAVKIANVLNLDSKKLEKQTMTELMKNLSKEDFNKLAENGIIQVGKAVAMTPNIEGNKTVEMASLINSDKVVAMTTIIEANK